LEIELYYLAYTLIAEVRMGRFLIIVGVVVISIGLFLEFAGKIPLIGKLPGDFVIRKENFTLYFPLATGIILSILLTVVLNLILRFFK
jgi:hypothetical protein